LLDGFDELSNKNINLASIIKNNFQNYPKIKIIVTTRPNYATDVELNNAFNNPKKIYICPFNKI
jgi:predicted NACHT family NTPase